MLRLIVRSAVQAVVLVFVVSALVFVLEALVPGDAARAILGSSGTPAEIAALRKQLGLDDPIWLQYVHYLGQIVSGSFGETYSTGLPVLPIILQALPVTLSLVLLGALAAMVAGVLLGTAGAVRRGPIGSIIDVLSLAGLALPNFWVGLILISLFAISVPLLPATGYVDLGVDPVGWARSLILPVAALALSGVAIVAKTTRDGMAEALAKDSVRTLRAAGLGEASIVWRHGLKNTAVPVLSVANLVFIGSLSGTVLVENVFALNGLGSLMVTAVNGHEVYEVEGVAIFYTVIVVVVNFLVDLAYGWFNPRVRRPR